jgi:hypothetical protein
MTVPALIEGNKTWKLVKIKENEADEITGVKLLRELLLVTGRNDRKTDLVYDTTEPTSEHT